MKRRRCESCGVILFPQVPKSKGYKLIENGKVLECQCGFKSDIYEASPFGTLVIYRLMTGNIVKFEGLIHNITKQGRIVADSNGIGVNQGIKAKRLFNMDFCNAGKHWRVLICFKAQEKIGKYLFDKRVKKLNDTLRTIIPSSSKNSFAGVGVTGFSDSIKQIFNLPRTRSNIKEI